jgi:hypothetical protein
MKTVLFKIIIVLPALITMYGNPMQAQLTPYPATMVISTGNITGTNQEFYYTPYIISPENSTGPVTISGNAHVRFTAGRGISLEPGFSTDITDGGNFEARIDKGLDMVFIREEPYSGLLNGAAHVKKWEKFEIGFNLPQEYYTAVNNFFEHYYNTPPVDINADLNPYADDSLIVEFHLYSPSGRTITRWAFFSRQATWGYDSGLSDFPDGTDANSYPAHADCHTDGNETSPDYYTLIENPADPLYPYNWRFRFAPDEEGQWTFDFTIKRQPAIPEFPEYNFSGFSFYCDPPLPDNHGFLTVNQNNKRYLQFDDQNSFFGIGENMNIIHDKGTFSDCFHLFYKRDFDVYLTTLNEMKSAGANYIRKFLDDFAIEWNNLGVYDKFYTNFSCVEYPPSKAKPSFAANKGNRQYQLWVFDKFFDRCRENNIYLQLCVFGYPAYTAYQTFGWGDHAYAVFSYDSGTVKLNSLKYFSDPTL